MGAIYRSNAFINIKPTADLAAGAIVKISDNLVVVTNSPIKAGTYGFATTSATLDVEITPGTSYKIGDLVKAPAVTLAGEPTEATVGVALAETTTLDGIVRVLFDGIRVPANSAS